MSIYAETKNLILAEPQARFIEASGGKAADAAANEVMRSRSGSQGILGFGNTQSSSEIYYSQFKQWVYVCITAISSRLKNLNWMAGELDHIAPNPERYARFGEKGYSPYLKREKTSRELHYEMQTLAKMPDYLRTKVAEGQEFEQIVGHESLDLLAKPNPVQHKAEYLDMMSMNLLISGEAYVIGGPWADSDVGAELWAVPTKWITPKHEGSLFSGFIFTPDAWAAQQELPVEEVMRVYFPDPSDPKKAISPLKAGYQSAVVDEKLQNSQADHFESGMFPSMAIKVAKLRNADGSQSNQRPMLSSAQRRQITRAVRQVWKQTTANRDPAILDGFIEDVFKLTHSPSEMDWPNSGKIIKERIYHTFRVNPIITGEVTSVNRAQAVYAEKSFVSNVVNPIADSISTAHTEFLGPWYDKPERLIVYLEKALPEDEELRFKKWQDARKNNDVTTNEFRANILNLPPLEPEDREEQAAPLLANSGGFQHAIQLAEKVRSKAVPRESGVMLVKVFLGLPEDVAEEMFPEPPEDPTDPTTGLPVGVVPPAGFVTNDNLFGKPEEEEGDEEDAQETQRPSDDDDPEKLARYEVRKALNEIHVKQVNEDASLIAQAMIPFLQKQIQSAADLLKEMTGSKLADVVKREASDTAKGIADLVFFPDNWIEELVKTVSPSISKIAAHGAITEMEFIEMSKDEKSTASDLLQELGVQGIDGISTEWPAWLQSSVRDYLSQQFAQPYWAGMNQTTLNDIRSYVETGLNEGWSIRRIANEIEGAFTGAYYANRAVNIAKTETTDALNAGHTMAIRQTGIETGLVAGKEWVSVMSLNTRESHADADGQIVGVDENFSVGGYAAPYPGHYGLPARERCQCQCTVISSFGINNTVQKMVAENGKTRETSAV